MMRHQFHMSEKGGVDGSESVDGRDALEMGHVDKKNTAVFVEKDDSSALMPILHIGLEDATEQQRQRQRPRCFCYRPWVCCCCVRFLGLPWMYKGPIILAAMGLIIMAVLSLDGNSCLTTRLAVAPLPDPVHLLPAGRSPPTAAAKKQREFVLTLLGDSLIIDPEWKYHFNNKIRGFLGNYNVTVYNHGRRAERMDDILTDTRLSVLNYSTSPPDWAKRPPNGIIIMSVSDVVTGGMAQAVPWAFGSDAYYAHQRIYAAQLAEVVRIIQKARIPVAIASPGTMEGEGLRLFMPTRLQGLAAPMADYCAFVQGWAADRGVPYIDIHNTFVGQIPPYRLVYNGAGDDMNASLFLPHLLFLSRCKQLRFFFARLRDARWGAPVGSRLRHHGQDVRGIGHSVGVCQYLLG